jgi:polysaccharide biosynthesis protein PslH
MRILFLTQVLPYPPELGASVKTWNVLRYLSLHGYDVTLASFVRPEEKEYVSHLKQVCNAVYTVPLLRSRVFDGRAWFRSLITGRPFLIERDDLPEMRQLVHKLLEENRFDLIHTDQLTMAQYALPSPVFSFPLIRPRTRKISWNPKYIHPSSTPRLVFDAHNAVWIIMERLRQRLPKLLHPLVKLEARRIKSYEGMLLSEFDHTLTLTEFDRKALYEAWFSAMPLKRKKRRFSFYHNQMGPTPITIVPIAVDAGPLAQITRRQGSHNILALGDAEKGSDADGIRWFLKEVFPLVITKLPDVKLTVVSKKTSADLCRYAAAAYPGRVSFTSCPGDARPVYWHCAAVVAPVRLETGPRSYILESFARGIPVITTGLGLDGIEARPGEDVLVADTPESFAFQVLRLLTDENLQKKLSVSGLRIVEERYDWMTALKPLDTVYQKNGVEIPV